MWRWLADMPEAPQRDDKTSDTKAASTGAASATKTIAQDSEDQFVETQVTNQLSGGKGIEFDMAKFNWIGAISPSNTACVARTACHMLRSRSRQDLRPLVALLAAADHVPLHGGEGRGSGAAAGAQRASTAARKSSTRRVSSAVACGSYEGSELSAK